MQYFLTLVDEYMLEILITSGSLVLIIFLARSFRRNMLIAQGQARFVVERYDLTTEKLHKWVTFVVLFMLLPLIGYVKFLGE